MSHTHSNHTTPEFSDNMLKMNKMILKQGAEVLALLEPKPGEHILDVGCGAGDLTAMIAAAGAIPTGIDLSEKMVNQAKQKYPDLHFSVENACHYRTDAPFDAVFSHAALHWIQDAEAVARSIWLALRDSGRFVAEFAGSGNVAALTTAIREELEARGHEWAGRSPWHLPTIGEYASLLERVGFRVTSAKHFDKPSPIKAELGIRNWLNSFEKYFFYDVTAEDKESIIQSIEAKLKPALYKDGQWMLDTSRLRIEAIKEPS